MTTPATTDALRLLTIRAMLTPMLADNFIPKFIHGIVCMTLATKGYHAADTVCRECADRIASDRCGRVDRRMVDFDKLPEKVKVATKLAFSDFTMRMMALYDQTNEPRDLGNLESLLAGTLARAVAAETALAATNEVMRLVGETVSAVKEKVAFDDMIDEQKTLVEEAMLAIAGLEASRLEVLKHGG